MNYRRAGQFYGNTNDTLVLNGIILNDADYTHDHVDWHYHENAYFTFLLTGRVLDGNNKVTHECSAGSLLFQNWQEPHYNVGSKQYTRGFHVELKPSWFAYFDMPVNLVEGSIRITDPALITNMYNVFKEMKLHNGKSQLEIDALLVQLFGAFTKEKVLIKSQVPAWVKVIREVLHDSPDGWKLIELAKLANVHPVHLSRHFSKYFKVTLGDYIRTIKVQKALSLLPNKQLSLTEIAAECGFADQSHFIRSFKSCHQLTPLHYRKLFLK
ncbi:helix-turn-helix domain-containing protein [Niastella sp. OAS944]|uniref:helix-turn-helix domain-containing protein n=1 Tax=Niastella sp. OAS944 TaxID=2664089 RepID=UPI003488A1D5|nr:AraC family transcriptional regulator [Chitinophagaceae bacterium OAS944]